MKRSRTVLPLTEKLNAEKTKRTHTFKRFMKLVETLIDLNRGIDFSLDLGDNLKAEDVPISIIIGPEQLQELVTCSTELKLCGSMHVVPEQTLINLLNMLQINISVAINVSALTDPDDDAYERKMLFEAAFETVMRAVNAMTVAMNILTSPKTWKSSYSENIIHQIIMFIEKQLQHTIYPYYDPVYCTSRKIGPDTMQTKRKKHSSIRTGKQNGRITKENRRVTSEDVNEEETEAVQILYMRMVKVLNLLAELVVMQGVTTNHISAMCSLATGPFMVENISEIHMAALHLLAVIFTTFEKFQDIVLDGLLSSTVRLLHNSHTLRTYKTGSKESIQILTAVVLQLIQCGSDISDDISTESALSSVLQKKCSTAVRIAGRFLSAFLNKCGSNKKEDNDYRKIFEAFVQDLLIVENQPEWPAVHLFMCILCNLFTIGLGKKEESAQFHTLCVRCLGLLLTRIRKNSVMSQQRLTRIMEIVKLSSDKDGPEVEKAGDDLLKNPCTDNEISAVLQNSLIDYLTLNMSRSQDISDPRFYYLVKWYSALKYNKDDKKKEKDETSGTDTYPIKDHSKGHITENKRNLETKNKKRKLKQPANKDNSVYQDLTTKHKKFIMTKIFSLMETSYLNKQMEQSGITRDDAQLVCSYLSSKEALSDSFCIYLQFVVHALSNSCTTVCAEAVKCLTMIFDVDPTVLGLTDIQTCIDYSLAHSSAVVREKTVDLIGKFVFSQPKAADKYYDCLIRHTQDPGLSVKKRVIKIVISICADAEEHPKKMELCAKILCKISDREESVRKLVLNVFQELWFTPIQGKDCKKKVFDIIKTISLAQNAGLTCFKELIGTLMKSEKDVVVEKVVTASQQIVDCLIDILVRSEEVPKKFIVWDLRVLSTIAKVCPQLLVQHVTIVRQYIVYQCQENDDYYVIQSAAEIIEAVIPIKEHPSEVLLSGIEESCVSDIFQQHALVIQPCISCLASVVRNKTKNYKLVADCFRQYFNQMKNFQKLHMRNPNDQLFLEYLNFLRRMFYIVGCFLRNFDFTSNEFTEYLPATIKDEVIEIFMYFLKQEFGDIQSALLCGLGALCVRHYEVMLNPDFVEIYHSFLTSKDVDASLKLQVLSNIEMYLEGTEEKLISQNKELSKTTGQINLKQLGDSTSSMASAIVQTYQKQVIQANLHKDNHVRLGVLEVIRRSQLQGLVDPFQVTPYLISAMTDEIPSVSFLAEEQLRVLQVCQPKAAAYKMLQGMKLAQELQVILQDTTVPRGLRDGIALHNSLYALMGTTRQSRHTFLKRLLQQFDSQNSDLSWLVYLSDNLASFSYGSLDEPLFVIYHINLILSISSANSLQIFKEALSSYPTNSVETVETIMPLLPDDISILQDCISAFSSFELLLSVKQYLQKVYTITNSTMSEYSPSGNLKNYEKSVNRQSNLFHEPKNVINSLKNSSSKVDNESIRKELILKFLQFKQLQESDIEDPDISNDRNCMISSQDMPGKTETNRKRKSASVAQNKIKPSAKHSKPKPKRNKRKRVTMPSSEEEDESDDSNEYDDPTFAM